VLDLLGGIFILLISMNLCAEPPESVLSAQKDRRATNRLVIGLGTFFVIFFAAGHSDRIDKGLIEATCSPLRPCPWRRDERGLVIQD
jgi:hypothetical protein